MRSVYVKLALAALLAFATPFVRAQDGLQGAFSRVNAGSAAHFRSPFDRSLTIADLDGDSKPDGAILLDSGWTSLQGSFRTI